MLNNEITYRDYRYRGLGADRRLRAVRAAVQRRRVANINIASWLFQRQSVWWVAGFAGALVGVVWNYAASNTFVWRRRRVG